MNKAAIFYLYTFFIGLILIGNRAACQPAVPFFRRIGPELGLSHPKVNSILQDSRGFLWFGTEDGLNRYDGRFFKVFRNVPNDTTCISGNIITDLCEDKAGILWIATADGGLTRYNYHLPAAKQFKQYKQNGHCRGGIPENHLNKITADNKGNLWLATGNGLLIRLNERSGKFDAPVKTGSRTILSLAMGSQDMLWVGSAGDGLLKLDTRTMTLQVDRRNGDCCMKLPHHAISALFKDRQNRLWYSSAEKRTYIYESPSHTGRTFAVAVPGNDHPGDVVVSFTEDNQQKIWMATQSSGLLVYDPGHQHFTSYHHCEKEGSLADDHVNIVFKDKSGVVWVGTDNGISVYDPVYSPFRQFNLPKTRNGNDIVIYDFYRDVKSGALWIATSNGIYIRHGQNERYEYRNIVYRGRSLAVTKFYADKDRTFYLGTDYTLFKYDRHTQLLSTLPHTITDAVMGKLVNSRIVSILRDTIGNHPALLVSPYGYYMTYYDFTEHKWISEADSRSGFIDRLNIRDNQIKKLYKDMKGGIWLATEKFGLGNWRRATAPVFYFTNDTGNRSSISSNDVFDIAEDKIGNFWISTYGGGMNYFNIRDRYFSHIPGSSNLTEGFRSDLHGNIWMICNGHMHEYNPLSGVYSCYDLPNLAHNGGLKGYVYQDNQGNLYAAGVNFYIEFNPDAIREIENAPPVYFTDFKIFNISCSQLLENKVIRLNHDENYFSLEFSAPEYSSNHMHYDYMLNGIDKDWIDADTRNYASYSNLPGGRYTFKVRASNWKGTPVSKFTTIEILISPPFWRTYWFYLLVILTVAPLVYLLYRYRLNEFLKRQAIRNEIAQDLHDQIGSTLSSISIYSKVAKLYRREHKAEKLDELLQTIGETAAETVSEMSDIVWSINPENDHIYSIVQKIQSYAQPLCRAQGVCFSLTCDKRALRLTLRMEARKNLFLILKEALNNAIKHSGCKNLSVDIKRAGNKIKMQVRDDGTGFSPANTAFPTYPSSGGGNGLRNMRSRAAELRGILEVTNRPGGGTSISLTFPVL